MSTNEHERGPNGGLKCIKARARTEKTFYTLPGRYMAPFPRERDRNPLPFRVPLVPSMFFLISQPRVSGPKTEHESFF